MNKIKISVAVAILLTLQACGTLTTEGTTLPFDVASTSGDVASTASGTTGGDESSAAAQAFLDSDMDWIKRDAARGQGEHINALAALLGESDQREFSRWMKQHYAEVFSNDAVEEVYGRIVTMRRNS